MNAMEKLFRKSSEKKVGKKPIKINVKLSHVNKTTASEKATYFKNTVFSLCCKIALEKLQFDFINHAKM